MKARPDEPGGGAGSYGTVEPPHTNPAHPRPERKDRTLTGSRGLKPDAWDQVPVQQSEPEKCIKIVTET